MPPIYRPRAWHLIAVAVIAVFDFIVLYMVLFPHVEADYRAYYIDRSSSCFPRIISGYYPLGEPVSFVPGRSGYHRDSIRWCGFMPPSNTGIRSFGDYGIFLVKVPLPDDDLLLTFSSWANTDSRKPPRQVQVVVNGEQIGTVTFASAKRVDGKMIIPQTIAKRAGKDEHGNDLLEVKFVVPRIGPPGTNSEPVTLQLRMEALRITPMSDSPVDAMAQMDEDESEAPSTPPSAASSAEGA